jgi:dTDP-glucose pyrophosphorylase
MMNKKTDADVSKFIISGTMTVMEALKRIDLNGHGVVFIYEDGKMTGVVSDGDIRRHILKNGNLNIEVKKIANAAPQFIRHGSNVNVQEYIRQNRITALPVLDDKGKIVRIEFDNRGKIYRHLDIHVPVVIMAGGKGTRLAPFTNILPKPLIPIGDKTITEHIIDRFQRFGCHQFYMIVNYRKNFIKTYFTEQENSPDLFFIEELKFQGTGGGIKLLEGKIKETFFLTNCDILVDEDYSSILDYHKEKKNWITLVCATKNIEIPYGTVQVSHEGRVTGFQEKPSFHFLTNTGFYVIEPEFLNLINKNERIDMTDLIQKCIDQGKPVGVYPITENSWMDMGQLKELENMRIRLGYMD